MTEIQTINKCEYCGYPKDIGEHSSDCPNNSQDLENKEDVSSSVENVEEVQEAVEQPEAEIEKSDIEIFTEQVKQDEKMSLELIDLINEVHEQVGEESADYQASEVDFSKLPPQEEVRNHIKEMKERAEELGEEVSEIIYVQISGLRGEYQQTGDKDKKNLEDWMHDIKKFKELVASVKSKRNKIKKIAIDTSSMWQQYQRAVLDKSEFADYEETDQKYDKLFSEEMGMNKKFLSGVRYRKEIQDLKQQMQIIQDIKRVSRSNGDVENIESTDKRARSDEDVQKFTNKIRNSIVKSIINTFKSGVESENEKAHEILFGGAEKKKYLDRETIDSLQRDFAVALLEKWEEEGIGSNEQVDEETRERMKEIVKKAIEMKFNLSHVENSSNYTAEEEEVQNNNVEQVNDLLHDLPTRFREDLVIRIRETQGESTKSFEDIAHFVAEQYPIIEKQKISSDVFEQVLEKLDGVDALDYDTKRNISDSSTGLRVRKSNKNLFDEFVKPLDINSWKAFVNNDEVKNKIGGEELEKIDRRLLNEFVSLMRYGEAHGARSLMELGKIEYIPDLIQHVMKQDSVSEQIYSFVDAITGLVKKIPPEELQSFIASVPDNQQEIIRQIADPESYLNMFDSDMIGTAERAKLESFRYGGDLLKAHSEFTNDLEEKTGDAEKAKDFYIKMLTHVRENKLEKIVNAAKTAGRDIPEVVQKYEGIFIASDFTFSEGRSPRKFIIELAGYLDKDPKEVYNKFEQSIVSSFPNNSDEAIKKLVKLADMTGSDHGDFVMRFGKEIFSDLDPRSKDSFDLIIKLADTSGIKPIDLIEARFDSFKIHPEDEMFQETMKYLGNDQNLFAKKIGNKRFGFGKPENEMIQQLYDTEAMKSSDTMKENTLVILGYLGRIESGEELIKKMLSKFSEGKISEADMKTSFEYLRLLNSIDMASFEIEDIFKLMIESLSKEDMPKSMVTILTEGVKKFVKNAPSSFIELAQKKVWVDIFGEEAIKQLLDSLPVETDEKRNAFTHNPYDRTSLFIASLDRDKDKSEFNLNTEELSILSNYVKRFKLSKTPMLYRYFKALYRHEEQGVKLPEDIKEDGVTSLEELENRMQRIQELVYGEPITEVPKLSKLELDLLSTVTGRSNHTFPGRPSMERIITEFNEASENKNIEKVPEAYKPFSMQLENADIKFNDEKAKDDFMVLQKEILDSIEQVGNIDNLKERSIKAVQVKIEQLQKSKKADSTFIIEELKTLKDVIKAIDESNDDDQLLGALLGMNKNTLQTDELESVLRETILQRTFGKHYPNMQLDELSASLRQGITSDSILRILDLHDDIIKEHVLNVNGRNDDKYWEPETMDKIARGSGKLGKVFQSRMKSLREAADNFESVASGSASEVRAIPDRGFIGEMSGYLANVCYTAEYPLLPRHDNVIPFKFVIPKNETGESEFIGSVLIFEIKTKDQEKALLVRGFDVPEDNKYNISKFIESFIDQMQKVAEERGATKIIVPSDRGAISNYTMTVNHFENSYVKSDDAKQVDLSEQFNFNNHDLTYNSYVAREVTPSDEK